MQDNTLIFVSDKSKYFFPYVDRENIRIEEIWKSGIRNKNSFLIRVCRKLKFPIGYFFGEWKKQIREYSKVIIFDGNYDKLLVYYLEKNNKKAKKVVFCWNTRKRLKHVLGSPYEIYSFDQNDCKYCGFKFTSTLYSSQVVLNKKEICYDVLFVGVVKERRNDIFKMYEILGNAKISKFFHIVGEREENSLIKQEKIEYPEYLDLIAKSRAILDICNPDQHGLSLRVMESIFFEKKLLTTNKTVKEYDFYCEDNILVITDLTNPQTILEFMNKSYKKVEKKIVDKYEISNWVKNL